MTNRERIEALLHREKRDRVPIWPFAYQGFAALYYGPSIAGAYTDPERIPGAQQKRTRISTLRKPWVRSILRFRTAKIANNSESQKAILWYEQ